MRWSASKSYARSETASSARRMQASGRQERVKASTSNISLGDERIPTFSTSYGRDFSAPFDGRIRRRACF